MPNFFWATWSRRELTLFVASFALLIAGWVTGNSALYSAYGLTFSASMFCWGAHHVESKHATHNDKDAA